MQPPCADHVVHEDKVILREGPEATRRSSDLTWQDPELCGIREFVVKIAIMDKILMGY